jgi:surface antigen
MGENSTVRVRSAFHDRHGNPCRVIEQTVTIAGQIVRATATVCQQSNGSWALVPWQAATGRSALR